MDQNNIKPILFEGEFLKLWKEASDEFSKNLNSEKFGTVPAELLNDPSKWPQTVKQRRKTGHLDAFADSAVSRHIQGISFAINAISSVFQLVATAVPIVTPATVVVQAFALAFTVFEHVKAEREKVETFFENMETLFKEISTLSEYLHGERRVAILRGSVVQVFVRSLEICENVISDDRGTIKKWIMTLSGDSKLDDLLESMNSAKDHLWRCIDAATYAEMKAAGCNLDAISSWTQRQDRDDILDWLSPLNFDSIHQRQLDQVEDRPNAGKWLLESEAFRQWKGTQGSRLWYTGKPGAGKSVLCSIIIRHLENSLKGTEEDPAVVFLYMSHKASPTVWELLGCILRQLVADMILVPPAVESEWKKKAVRVRTESRVYAPPDQATLMKLLSELTAKRQIHVILDALDECNQAIRQELLTKLKGISDDVRILVTARLLENRDDLSQDFEMQSIQAKRADIEEYIDSMIERDVTLQKGNRDHIKRTIREKAGGMFLLARLHMHAISNLDGPDEISDRLEELPKSVDESYAKSLDRIREKDDDRKRKAPMILGWVSFAERPLKCDELSHAIATQVSQNAIKRKDLIPQEKIALLCCGMIEIDVENIVRFVHYSAHSFFQQKKSSDFADYKTLVPLACAKYLCMDALGQHDGLHDSGHSIQQQSVSEKLKLYPFAEYAGQYLHHHFKAVRKQEEGSELFCNIRNLVTESAKRNFYYKLLSDSETYFTHVPFLDGDRRFRYSSYSPWSSEDEGEDEVKDEAKNDTKDDTVPLHLPVFLGCPALVENLIKIGSEVDVPDDFKQTPLTIAFKQDFGDVAGILLHHGATVDLSNKRGHAFILYAAQRNYHKAVHKILEATKEAEIKWTILDLWTLVFSPLLVLLWLVRGTRTKTLSALESDSLETTEDEGQGPTLNREQQLLKQCGPILSLAYEGKFDMLRDVVISSSFQELGETPSDNNKDGNSDSDTDSWMTDRDASDSGLQARDFLITACFLAVERGHANTVGVLLDHGVPANTKNFHGQPLLHRAAFRGRIDIVKLLLDKGALIDLEDNSRRTAYTAHANVDNVKVLSYLQKKGANICHRGRYDVHELYRAAAFGNEKMVQFFLQAGVSASVTNQFSWTPLHEASANGHLECVKLLLEAQAYHSPISDVGKTPLDLVISGEPHYDWPLLGEDSEHYLNGQVYKEKEWILQDQERLDKIRRLLESEGAKTSEELYNLDKSKFEHVKGGIYAGGGDYDFSSDLESEEASDLESTSDSSMVVPSFAAAGNEETEGIEAQ